MTKKQARNARNRRYREAKIWSEIQRAPSVGSNMIIACGSSDSMTVFDRNGRHDYEGVSPEISAAIILDKAFPS